MLMAATEFVKRAFTKGPSNSLQSVLSVVDDYVFDRRHQLDTRSEVAINDLDISDEDKQHADKYKPTRARYFRKIMAKLDLPREGVFVDVGCGKGRILLLAAEHGFDQVVGLEISPSLCEIAERNVASFRENTPTASSIEVVCTNILDYQMDGSETVFFLYSPFDQPVTKTFLEMIRQSINDHPRDLWLIIDEFRFPELLEDDELLKQSLVYEYGSAIFHVYHHLS
ncbi:class I SAM-dependent methyltransferase [Aporhodopirellula aestuarii]|uniref:Class I SAM-dependent methyltransferase n=1 Tax=Aporhodopirellula aestuarii TaxID=2950107 RepID=A0ABT0U1I9_9BACT|nr:class I SAM-dependent methyltransferase [Aporhodopirellula aestuarii]MCM2370722.1 class I SAM-dependent methyltransferase [Aporhodopirellula aestuarii]